MQRIIILLFAFLLICSNHAHSQVTIDTSISIKNLVQHYLLGDGVKVGNITFTGNKLAIARFDFKTTPIDVKKGVLLCTGSVFNAQGPNKYPYTTTGFVDVKTQKKIKGDKDLNRIAHNNSYDAAILEFDFVPTNNKISFKYCFASEEYPEYVGSRYNDVFGFFITGGKLKAKNLATLPLSIAPITVNSINQKENKKAFIDNDYFTDVKPTKETPGTPKKKTASANKNKKKADVEEEEKVEILFEVNKKKKAKLNQAIVSNIEYDGITRALVAWCYVTPYQKYHIKIAIADVGDNSYDSGVFLEQGSFESTKDTRMPHFKEYADVSSKINFDSIMYGVPKKVVIPQAQKLQEKQDSIDDAEADYFRITNVNFASDSYVIPDTAQKNLDNLIAYLMRHQKVKLQLYGYTDNKGDKDYNQKLSTNRAENVMNYLTARKITAKRISISGFNFERPAADNTSEEGRSRNIIVEISLNDDDEKIAKQQKHGK
jgi:outer membrane protein OmpA-like peptidoglycan-associated protein